MPITCSNGANPSENAAVLIRPNRGSKRILLPSLCVLDVSQVLLASRMPAPRGLVCIAEGELRYIFQYCYISSSMQDNCLLLGAIMDVKDDVP
jgi:hypothetical protein